MNSVFWGNQAVADRMSIFRFLVHKAGAKVAIATDERFIALSSLLSEHSKSGHAINGNMQRRRLIVPHFPFVMVYALESHSVRILRVIHTSRKIAVNYTQKSSLPIKKPRPKS